MGLFDHFPYTNFHELNLDWILNALRELEHTIDQFVAINALKYADPIQWNIVSQYEKNTIVIDPLTGTAYISVQPVPGGVSITNTDYWTVVFDLGSFVVRAAKNFTDKWEDETTLSATFPSNVNDWLIWGDVLYRVASPIIAGDQYVAGSNIVHFTAEDVIGHIQDLNTTDKSNLVAAINELVQALIDEAARVNGITGDLDDLNTTDKSNLVTAINEVLQALIDTCGDLDTLDTADNSNLVAAINEILSNLGDISTLHTNDTSNTVAAINEIFDTRYYLTPEMFGAVGDGTTDDTIALQDCIDAANIQGKPIICKAVTYLITSPLNLYNGIHICGATSAHIFVDSFPNTTIKADFTPGSTNPVLNISENVSQYASDLLTRVDEIIIKDITIDGNGAFCGIKAEVRNSIFENVTVQYCKIGLYFNRVYTTYLNKIAALFCDVGCWCRQTNINMEIANSWFTYGAGILNDDDMDALIISTLSPDQTKKTGLYLLNSSVSVQNTTMEAYYYGVFLCRGSSLYADNHHTELIVAGGSCFHDNPVANVNFVKVTNASFYNGPAYSGSIAAPGYRSMYDIESIFEKPANFADPTLATRGSFRLRYRNEEIYLPVNITNIVNPTITNNHTHFDENGNLVIDFVLEDYDSYSSGYCLIKVAALDNNGYSGNTGFSYFMGMDLKCNLTNLAIVTIGGGSTAPDKNKRYFLTIPYDAA